MSHIVRDIQTQRTAVASQQVHLDDDIGRTPRSDGSAYPVRKVLIMTWSVCPEILCRVIASAYCMTHHDAKKNKGTPDLAADLSDE